MHCKCRLSRVACHIIVPGGPLFCLYFCGKRPLNPYNFMKSCWGAWNFWWHCIKWLSTSLQFCSDWNLKMSWVTSCSRNLSASNCVSNSFCQMDRHFSTCMSGCVCKIGFARAVRAHAQLSPSNFSPCFDTLNDPLDGLWFSSKMC